MIFTSREKTRKKYPIAPYSYKMVSGIDFYERYLKRISSYPNITFRQETVTKNNGSKAYRSKSTYSNKNTYRPGRLLVAILVLKNLRPLQNILFYSNTLSDGLYKQKKPVFNASQATFMDFSVHKKAIPVLCMFCHFSRHLALVEYTLFSETLLPKEEYEEAITDIYGLLILRVLHFEIIEKEQGSIPMTCIDFTFKIHENVYHIGTAGGWSKPSTRISLVTLLKKHGTDSTSKGKQTSRLPSKKKSFLDVDVLLIKYPLQEQ